MSFLSQFFPLFVLTTERKERGLQRERNKKHIIVVENATLRALCDVRRREMSITFLSLRQSPSFSYEKRRDIHPRRRPLSRYFSRHDEIFCSLLSLHFVVKNALKRKEKTNRKREREKRDANVFSLLSPRKRENTIPYSHETMPYFSLLYICIRCVCVLSVEQQ
jgi:hypothetical protein